MFDLYVLSLSLSLDITLKTTKHRSCAEPWSSSFRCENCESCSELCSISTGHVSLRGVRDTYVVVDSTIKLIPNQS